MKLIYFILICFLWKNTPHEHFDNYMINEIQMKAKRLISKYLDLIRLQPVFMLMNTNFSIIFCGVNLR